MESHNTRSIVPGLFTEHIFFEVYPHCRMHQNFILFNFWVILHCKYIAHFVYPFICWWTLGCFHLLVIVNNIAMNIHVQVCTYIFTFIAYKPSSRKWLCHFTSPWAMCEGYMFSTPLPSVVIFCLVEYNHPSSVKEYLMVLICISFKLWCWGFSCVNWPFLYLLWRHVYSGFFAHF